ncbi:MAG: AAA family ATPase [Candidatus Micrarchaeota archaeon]
MIPHVDRKLVDGGVVAGGRAIEINPGFSKALGLMEDSGRNVLVTGKAGTGKSTLLEYFCNKTEKDAAVLAPTGVAAVNVNGRTIHSFFGFKPDVTLEKVRKIPAERARVFRELDAIVIDEVSMVRSDLLDCVDKFLRLNSGSPREPFGGKQMLFFGDLYQLPPIVTAAESGAFKGVYASPFFFDSRSFCEAGAECVELEKVYRQKDAGFINILNAIRNNTAGEGELAVLNSRLDPGFKPGKGDFCITLTTTNDLADSVNAAGLSELRGPIRSFNARVSGAFDKGHYPASLKLDLKKESQVMFLNNDSSGRWVNGTMGRVAGFQEAPGGPEEILVGLPDGGEVGVAPFKWSVFSFSFNPQAGRLESVPMGSFTQYPLRLAWAVTIHKSQGKTFDNVVVDVGRGTFVPGQLYVALSRCRTLDGIRLRKPLLKRHVYADWRVVKFATSLQYRRSELAMPLQSKRELVEKTISQGGSLRITYLKANDVKSQRVITPLSVGRMFYEGKEFLGVKAFCHSRNEERTFRLDRVLAMEAVEAGEARGAANERAR